MTRKNKKKKGRGGVLRGAVYGAAAIVLLLSAFAALVNKKPSYADYAEPIVTVINIISAMLCGICAVGAEVRRGVFPSVAAGATLFTLIMLAAIILDFNNISARGACEIALISLGGSAVGSLLKLCKSDKKLRYKSSR